MAVKNHAKTDTNRTFLLLSSFTGLFDFVPNILSGIVGSMTVSVPYFTALLFVDYRHWKFVRLYLLFLIMKAPLIIGGDKPFKNLYNFLARLSKLFWCIVFSTIISRMPRKYQHACYELILEHVREFDWLDYSRNVNKTFILADKNWAEI